MQLLLQRLQAVLLFLYRVIVYHTPKYVSLPTINGVIVPEMLKETMNVLYILPICVCDTFFAIILFLADINRNKLSERNMYDKNKGRHCR